mmetsp:Transcript_40978/g.73892  ORF Transcript_40978/g.73892 Transcript_40978/m.73892 type:complete len:169 (+) Transcript_40978:1334-1840(+)
MKSRPREFERNKTTDVRQELSSAKSNGSNKQIETLQKELSQITAMKEAEVGIGNLQEVLTFVKKHLEDAEGNKKRLTNDLESYQRRIAIADTSIETLSSRLNAAQTERDSLNKEMTAKLDEMTNQKENSSAQFNSIITILEGDLLESRQMEERLVSAMKIWRAIMQRH